jgi:hypothetical protein
VAEWIDGLTASEFGAVAFRIDRLASVGPTLRAPHSKALGDGLYELRFDLDRVAWRLTYWFAPQRRIVLLTAFRKQRMNERAEITKARRVLAICRSSHPAAEVD